LYGGSHVGRGTEFKNPISFGSAVENVASRASAEEYEPGRSGLESRAGSA
jgi:hypothetical protein